MSLTSNIYNNKLSVKTDVKKNKANSTTVKSYNNKHYPRTKCKVCGQYRATKRLSKKDRAVWKSKLHPICNDCRSNHSKLGTYSKIRDSIIADIIKE